MRELWDTFKALLRLHEIKFQGEVRLTFEDGVCTYTRTTAGRKPAELGGSDEDLVAFLAKAQSSSSV